jgi:S-adenosylmethionine:tRNA ribosyltransferase-isomerase
MHGEVSFVSEEVSAHLLAAKHEGRSIIAVGTTSTRTLEGRAKRAKFISSPGGSAAQVSGDTQNLDLAVTLPAGEEEINLFIYPGSGHDWKMVDGMLTNFHLPESTLLMMVASFIGDLEFTRTVYETAIREKYRFYSYGDAMLILP